MHKLRLDATVFSLVLATPLVMMEILFRYNRSGWNFPDSLRRFGSGASSAELATPRNAMRGPKVFSETWQLQRMAFPMRLLKSAVYNSKYFDTDIRPEFPVRQVPAMVS